MDRGSAAIFWTESVPATVRISFSRKDTEMEVIIASEEYDALFARAKYGDRDAEAALRIFAFLVVPRELFDRLRGETGVS